MSIKKITTEELIDYRNSPDCWCNKLDNLPIGNTEPLVLKGLLMTKQLTIDGINDEGKRLYKYSIRDRELLVWRIK